MANSLGPWYQQFVIDGLKTTTRPFMSKEYFDQIRPLFPENLVNLNILDLACNAGLVSFELAKLGAKVLGVDNNPTYIAQAQYIQQQTDISDVKFILADIETIYPIYKYDVVILLSALYHLSNPRKMAAKLDSLDSDLVLSFRLNNYDKYISLFKRKQVIKEASYAKKRAVLLR